MLLGEKNTPKGVLDDNKLYRVKQVCWKESERCFGLRQTIPSQENMLERVGKEFWSTPNCAKQRNKTPKGEFWITPTGSDETSHCKAKTTQTTMTSTTQKCYTYAFQKKKKRIKQAHHTTLEKLAIPALRQHTQALLQHKRTSSHKVPTIFGRKKKKNSLQNLPRGKMHLQTLQTFQ